VLRNRRLVLTSIEVALAYMGVILLLLAATNPVARSGFGPLPTGTHPNEDVFYLFLLGMAFLGSGVVVTLALPPVMQRRDKLPVIQQPS